MFRELYNFIFLAQISTTAGRVFGALMKRASLVLFFLYTNELSLNFWGQGDFPELDF